MRVPQHVHESIDAIADLHAQDRPAAHQQRIERLASSLGRPRSLYLLVGFIAGWMVANVSAIWLGRAGFDQPPFPILQTIMSAIALIMTTMVLIVENRQSQTDEKRSNLDLQINLLAERKTAKIIELLETLRHDLPSVPNSHDDEAREMSTALDPKTVAEALEKSLENDD